MTESPGDFDAPRVAATRLVDTLAEVDRDADDAVRIDRIRLLEELRAKVAAAQAIETAAFARSQREKQAAASEWRAFIVARETIWLSRADRAIVDSELAPRLERLGDRRVEAEAKRVGYRIDPVGALARVRGAESDRRVTVRPAPDTMARLTCLAPVAQGVAAYATLSRDAGALMAQGDGRCRGQLMADLAIERLTGQAVASEVPVEVELVISAEALLDGGTEPALLVGHGPVPAGWARQLITQRDDQAPIRHTDHVQPAAERGPTSVINGEGLCETCNHAKQAHRWRTRPTGDGSVETITPTGHRYRSRAPDPPTSHRHLEITVDTCWPVAA